MQIFRNLRRNYKVNRKFKSTEENLGIGLNTDAAEHRKEVWRSIRHLHQRGLKAVLSFTDFVASKLTCITPGLVVEANKISLYCDGRTPAEVFYCTIPKEETIPVFFIPFVEAPVNEISFDSPLPALAASSTTHPSAQNEDRDEKPSEVLVPEAVLRRAQMLNLDHMGRPAD